MTAMSGADLPETARMFTPPRLWCWSVSAVNDGHGLPAAIVTARTREEACRVAKPVIGAGGVAFKLGGAGEGPRIVSVLHRFADDSPFASFNDLPAPRWPRETSS